VTIPPLTPKLIPVSVTSASPFVDTSVGEIVIKIGEAAAIVVDAFCDVVAGKTMTTDVDCIQDDTQVIFVWDHEVIVQARPSTLTDPDVLKLSPFRVITSPPAVEIEEGDMEAIEGPAYENGIELLVWLLTVKLTGTPIPNPDGELHIIWESLCWPKSVGQFWPLTRVTAPNLPRFEPLIVSTVLPAVLPTTGLIEDNAGGR